MTRKSTHRAKAPRSLAQLLQSAGGALGEHGRSDLATLRLIWPPLVGQTLAQGTQIAAVRGRTVHVRAAHRELARELEFLREHVIRGFEEYAPRARIRDMRIRVAPLEEVAVLEESPRIPRSPRGVAPGRVEEAQALVAGISDPELRESFAGWIVQADRWARAPEPSQEGESG